MSVEAATAQDLGLFSAYATWRCLNDTVEDPA